MPVRNPLARKSLGYLSSVSNTETSSVGELELASLDSIWDLQSRDYSACDLRQSHSGEMAAKIDHLSSQLETSTAENTKLKEEMQRMAKENCTLTTKLTKVEDSLEVALLQKSALEQTLAKLGVNPYPGQRKWFKFGRRSRAANLHLAQLQKDSDELVKVKDKLRITEGELMATADEVVAINEEVHSAKEELESTTDKLRAVTEELSSTSSLLEAANAKVAQVEDAIAELNDQVSVDQKNIAQLHQYLNKERELNFSLADKLARVEESLEKALEANVSELKRRSGLGALRDKKKQLKKHKAEMKEGGNEGKSESDWKQTEKKEKKNKLGPLNKLSNKNRRIAPASLQGMENEHALQQERIQSPASSIQILDIDSTDVVKDEPWLGNLPASL